MCVSETKTNEEKRKPAQTRTMTKRIKKEVQFALAQAKSWIKMRTD